MKQEKRIWEKSRAELFRELDCQETGLSQAARSAVQRKTGPMSCAQETAGA